MPRLPWNPTPGGWRFWPVFRMPNPRGFGRYGRCSWPHLAITGRHGRSRRPGGWASAPSATTGALWAMPRRFWPGEPGSDSGPTNWRRAAMLASRTARPGVSWRGSAPPPLLSSTDGATRFAGWPRRRRDLIAGICPASPNAAANCSRSRSPIPGWRRESPPGRRTCCASSPEGWPTSRSQRGCICRHGPWRSTSRACCARPALAPEPAWRRPRHRPQPATLSGRYLPGHYVVPAGIYVLFPM